jgi:hypothetical protein
VVLLKATGLDDLISIAAAWVKRFQGAKPMRALAFGAALFALLVPVAAAQNSLPQIQLMLQQPYESQREAFFAARGKHEELGFDGASKVWTVYLWRHIYLYDSRADLWCRDASALKAKMATVDATPEGELYVVIGQRALTAMLSPDLVGLVKDESLFEKTHTFWAEEDIHTLEVYRYKGR